MRQWDATVVSRVRQYFGHGAARSLVYRVIGDMDGIAVTKGGDGFCRVELAVNSDRGTAVLSGIMTVHFVPESSRLRSAGWSTVADCMVDETLGYQMVYPSVVSLDQFKTDEGQGPGMTI
jgi:hypothetical protein